MQKLEQLLSSLKLKCPEITTQVEIITKMLKAEQLKASQCKCSCVSSPGKKQDECESEWLSNQQTNEKQKDSTNPSNIQQKPKENNQTDQDKKTKKRYGTFLIGDENAILIEERLRTIHKGKLTGFFFPGHKIED